MAFIFLKTADVCSNYMCLFEKDYVEYQELFNWSEFITEKLKTKYKEDTILNKYYSKEFKEDYDLKKYFISYKTGVGISPNANLETIRRQFCAFTSVDILMTMFETVDEYKKLIKTKQQEIERI